MIGRTIDEMAVGDVAEATREMTPEVIQAFLAATGDANPIHSDAAFAAGTRFGRVISPGVLTGSLLSAVIGSRLPGPGTIYLSQEFRFLRPVYLGDTVTARVEVAEIVRDRNRVRLTTVCLNQAGEMVLEGDAWVLPSRERVVYRPAARPGAAATLAWLPVTLAANALGLWVAWGLALAAHALPGPLPDRATSGGRRA